MEKGIRDDVEILIDITRIPNLDWIYKGQNNIIHIGPLVTHNHCLKSDLIYNDALSLSQACSSVGSPQIRNRVTVIGNIVTASPANDTIPPLMALGAVVSIQSFRGTRTVPLKNFYTGVRKSILADDELVIDVSFPAPTSERRSIFMKSGLRKAQAISIASVAITLDFQDSKITNAAITLGSVAPTVFNACKAENYLIGKQLTLETISQAAELSSDSCSPIDDIRSGAWYRKEIINVYTKRCLQKLKEGKEREGFRKENVSLRQKESWHVDKPLADNFIHFGSSKIETKINGKKYEFQVKNRKTLLQLLRQDTDLLGTKDD